MTVYIAGVPATVPDDRLAAYRNLLHAADQAGDTAYAAQRAVHARAGRSPRTFRYVPTAAQRTLIDAATAVLGGRLGVEPAMALMTHPEIMAARFGGSPR